MQNNDDHTNTNSYIIFIIVGVVMILGSLAYLITAGANIKQLTENSIEVQGEIVYQTPRSLGTTYIAIPKSVLNAGDTKEYQAPDNYRTAYHAPLVEQYPGYIILEVPSRQHARVVGDTITLYVNPENPYNYALEHAKPDGSFYVIIAMGALFVIAGIKAAKNQKQ